MKPDEHPTAPLQCQVKGNRLEITILVVAVILGLLVMVIQGLRS